MRHCGPIQLVARLLAVWLPAASLAAQDERFERVQLRVSSAASGAAVEIDRGEVDGVEIGDLALFQPRSGGVYRGTVTQVSERSAIVEMRDPSFVPALGTRGEILVPIARRQPPPAGEQPPAEGQPSGVVPVAPPPPAGEETPRWQNPDEGYEEGMPLLAQVNPVRPEDRARQFTGRMYIIADLTSTPEDGFSDTFFRVGGDTVLDNPFGAGGTLRAHTEFNYKTEFTDQAGFDFLARRVSYARGGTRYDANRWEVGRFLQHGMPEFGVLDGFEWGTRRKNGDRFGASFGWLPEQDDDFESLEDLQVAAYYLWSADDSERITFGGGYQKTLHNGKTDRDLVVLKGRYLTENGWDLIGRSWFDFYYGRDDIKNNGVELTQALLSARRTWRSGNSLDIFYRRQLFPETLRNEFQPPVLAAALADNRYDRIGVDGRHVWSSDTVLHGHLSAFDDEDDTGGAAEAGVEVVDLWYDESLTDFTVFYTSGNHTNDIGVRVAYGRNLEDGRFDLFYEVSDRHILRFPDNGDDILQQRLRASRAFYGALDWDLTVHGEIRFWDEEFSWTLGMYFQKTL